jgi:amino acid adenylation domain-containing protein
VRRDLLLAFQRGLFPVETLKSHLASIKGGEEWPLSVGQRGLWMLDREVGAGYNVPLAFRIRGSLDIAHLRSAWAVALLDHPGLRVCIRQRDGALYQRTAAIDTLPFVQVDAADWTDDQVDAWLRARIKQPIALDHGPIASLSLLRRNEREHIALIVTHHIVFDGGSVEPLFSSLLGTYAALARGETRADLRPSPDYDAFLAWERHYLAGPQAGEDRAYWREMLAGPLPRLEMPTDRSRASRKRIEGGTHGESVPEALAAGIRRATTELRITPGVLFLAVYTLLLHRSTGETDIIVGVPTYGRPEPDFERVVGLFSNPIALRTTIDGDASFSDWARRLQRTMLDGMAHANYPFSHVVRDLDLSREQAFAPVFQVAYEYESSALADRQRLGAGSGDALEIEVLDDLHQDGYYELICEVAEQSGQFRINLKYDRSLFDATTVARMAASCLHLLAQVVERADDPLRTFSPLPESERRRLVHAWNATDADYPRDRRIESLVSAQTLRTPDAIAIGHAGATASYAALEARADALATWLMRHGAGDGTLVAVCLERSIDLVASLLAVLKCGAAYVPLDPAYPPDRLRLVLEDGRVGLLLTQTSLLDTVGPICPPSTSPLCVESCEDTADAAALAERATALAPDRPAYVIFTSGSTGRPKGVVVAHRSVVNFLWSMRDRPGMTAEDRLLAVTSISFDIAGLELFLPLVTGARCEICDAGDVQSGEALKAVIARTAPTVMQATPTTWQMLLQAGWKNVEGMKILCGGEAMPDALWDAFTSQGWEAWNLYGPTETTIWSTAVRLDRDSRGSIGRGIANTRIYILDRYGEPAPTLAQGELCIAGDGVACGYLDRPEQTAERFVQHPLEPDGRLYRTGDLARWRSDGQIEYIGRSDTQTKIRGYRIELGEIEATLCAHPSVAECAVVVAGVAGLKQLVAFCVPASTDAGGSPDVRALRDHLRRTLPSYMLPARFVGIPALPLTPNRKVDRKTLTAMAERPEGADDAVASAPAARPSNPAADAIVPALRAIWRGVIGTDRFRDDEGFFDIGGDSVSAMLAAEQIAVRFGCDFPVGDMFRLGTIERIAGALTAKMADATADVASTAATHGSAGSASDRDTTADARARDPRSGRIAIIGMACRFPGAQDHRQFWDNLRDGVESIAIQSPQAQLAAGLPAKFAADPRYVAAWGRIDGKELFDADFFRVSVHDAHRMDPQMRLLLQHAWAAIEDAGYLPQDIPDTGVFTATSHSDYATLLGAEATAGDGVLSDGDQYVAWLLAQSGTVPTMISHRLGLIGPSLAVHANCSSSLVAMHTASRCLLAGEVRQALVGAASIGGTRVLGYLHQKGLNFSRDGRIRAFDAGADGMVGGEGVAVVLLKREEDAIADGDHIHAVLLGIALNNDGAGKAGYYAPSAEGQERVILAALGAAGVDPETIGYVEAHGTGTELGDPIEMSALTSAYRRSTDRTGYCAIGSVKTNVGHLDTVAGLAGCVKLALCLSSGMIPASLNHVRPNPALRIETSPFFVVDRLTAWPAGATPRRAGLSSFGIGGTNVHAIFEAPPDPASAIVANAVSAGPIVADAAPQLFVLSTRSAGQLSAYAEAFIAWLRRCERDRTPVDMARLTCTLQFGRLPMSHRLAFVVRDAAELRARLEDFVAGGATARDCVGVVLDDAPRAVAAATDLESLAAAWRRGDLVDWRALRGDVRPRRLSLPTYPFAGDRFWPEARSTGSDASDRWLHPMLHRNTSTLAEQRFSTRMTGAEPFLRDHRVAGVAVLPGVAYLEMARAALQASIDPAAGRILLRNVVWLRPLRVTAPTWVHIALAPREDGGCSYEIYSTGARTQAPADARIVHGSGRLIVDAVDDTVAAEAQILDLAALRAGCVRRVSGTTLYGRFVAMGIDYGPSHVVVDEVRIGRDAAGARYVLAELRLPGSAPAAGSASAERGEYVLHPGILDGALQAVTGLVFDETEAGDATLETRAHLPFALDEIEIRAQTPPEAVVRVHPAATDPRAGLHRYDIDVCDPDGLICLRLRGFTARVLSADSDHEATGVDSTPPAVSAMPIADPATARTLDEVMATLRGMEQALARLLTVRLAALGVFEASSDPQQRVAEGYRRWLAGSLRMLAKLGELDGDAGQYRPARALDPERTRREWDEAKARWSADDRVRAYAELADLAMAELDGILAGRVPATSVFFPNASLDRVAGVYRNNPIIDYFNGVLVGELVASVAARLRSDPEAKLRIIEIGAGTGGTSTLAFARLAPYRDRIAEYRYTDLSMAFLLHAEREYAPIAPSLQCSLFDVERHPSEQGIPTAHYDIAIATNVLHATRNIRRTLAHAKATLRPGGQLLINEISTSSVFSHVTFGLLEGWWLYEDPELRIEDTPALAPEGWQRALTEAGMRQVRFPAEARHDLGLQIVVATSDGIVAGAGPVPVPAATTQPKTVSAATVAPGQDGDEARFALRERAILAVRRQVAAALERALPQVDADVQLEKYGIDSILVVRICDAMNEVFGDLRTTLFFEYRTISALVDHLLDTRREQVERWVGPAPAIVPRTSEAAKIRSGAVVEVDDARLRERAVLALRRLVASTLHRSLPQVDADVPLEKYGIDSILVVKICDAMNDAFDDLRTTLFFEYRTISAIADHLLSSRREQVVRWTGSDVSAREAANPQPPSAGLAAAGESMWPASAPTASRFRLSTSPPTRQSAGPLPTAAVAAPAPSRADAGIAIIGLSGRYPRSGDVAQFWEALSEGRNCISEIPASRWDWRRYFHPERGRFGAMYTRWGGFLDDIDCFDPLFFDLSPRQAEHIDPQERLFLEEAYACIEDAGYTPQTLSDSRRVGVYVGAMNSTYMRIGSFWSIANRVSYLFDFRGPSMAVDTACSSSLTAIQLAVESLRGGLCDTAIAGGVNLIVDPAHYQALSALTMLSSGERCRSFGDRADGFVDGEGVGAVVLKPLDAARRDGDHIHGIIRGAMINAGGRTNGYTVPNPVAQAEVVAEALDRAGVHPRAVTCIEAHGTGTALGDPIEIDALTKAFRRGTDDRQFCAIGSVKSNIGHCESAAGIAGLTKLLLQMQHGRLVPSLHADVPNPQIDFERSPFVLQRALAPWPRPRFDAGDGLREHPRIGGVSSFGAGGANAHVIVEESPTADEDTSGGVVVDALRPALIVLSARTGDALRRRALRLADAIASGRCRESDLAALAYTLQIGREAMPHRMAFSAASLESVRRTLEAYAGNRPADEEIHADLATDRPGGDALFAGDEEMQEAVAKWIARGKHAKVLAAWVRGLPVDWRLLYPARRPRRLSLPTYPFEKVRCWIDPGSFLAPRPATGERERRLHPLLHENTSTFAFQRYSATLDADDFPIADHRVHGRRILPGVACLEMALAALRMADPEHGHALRNIVWARPLAVDPGPLRVHVELQPLDDEFRFEILSGETDADRCVHVQGVAVRRASSPSIAIDIDALRALSDRHLAGDACYSRLAAQGLQYGETGRGLDQAEAGVDRDGRPFVLARLRLGPAAIEAGRGFGLHPTLLDSALQAAAAMWQAQTTDAAPSIPFALDALDIDDPAAAVEHAGIAHAVIRREPGDGGVMTRLHVHLCDARGRVLVRMLGLSSRKVAGASSRRTVLLGRHWQTSQAPSQDAVAAHRLVVLCQDAGDPVDCWAGLEDALSAQPGLSCERWRAPEGDLVSRCEHFGWRLIETLKRVMASAGRDRKLIQVVVSGASDAGMLHGLSGILRTAQLEHPSVHGQWIELAPADDIAGWRRKLDDAAGSGEHAVRYRAEVRETEVVAEIPAEIAATRTVLPWKPAGVYVIVGGGGGLGVLFADEILRHAPDARIVLAGRSEAGVSLQSRLDRWRDAGRTVEYRRVDAAEPEAARRLLAEIEDAHGALDGVIHSAGIVRDSFVIAKTREEYAAVLRTKLRVAASLDAAIDERPIDFFALFSSIAGSTGNVGQADYAAANAFLDAFAARRRQQVDRGERHGRTVAIAWPLWANGGMRMPDVLQAQLRAQGLESLEDADGFDAFHRAMAGDAAWVGVRQHAPVIDDASSAPAPADAAQAGPQRDAGHAADGHDSSLEGLRRLIAGMLKIPVSQLDPGAPFARYGIDSVLVMQLTSDLEKTFGSLPKTLFFEYPNLAALHRYFAEHHADALRRSAWSVPVAEGPAAATPAVPTDVPTAVPARSTQRSRFAPAPRGNDEDLAIIGLSGRFPGAPTVEAFWDVLRDGRDCVSVVPAERWDADRIFDPDRSRPGTSCGKWGSFIDDVGAFDPLFFEMSPREAEFTDPQQRLFLETTWNLFESSGYTRARIADAHGGRIGVYVGSMYNHYDRLQQPVADAQVVLQSFQSGIANRVSHFFGLCGPSIAIDTLCSSSLVALHLACADLRRGACELAVAGAVNLSLDARKFVSLSQAQLLGSRFDSRSFGDGDGYLPAEAVGAVLLKPLARAEQDGDEILAIVRATAVNHAGAGLAYSAPNAPAQVQVIRDVLRAAHIAPESIGYIEAAASGSAIGDAVELTALAQVFEGAHCALGAVKSNIGHAEAASGITQLAKVLLQLRHGALAPTIHGETPNPHVRLEDTGLRLQRELAEWKRPLIEEDGVRREVPRRALINAFGAGGTYASAVLEEYRDRRAPVVPVVPAEGEVVVVSARTATALRAMVGELVSWLERDGEASLVDIAYTLQMCREAMAFRLAAVVRDRASLLSVLREYLADPEGCPDSLHVGDPQTAAQLQQLAPGDFAQSVVDAAIARRDLDRLAWMWTRHLAIDWQVLRRGAARRVDLPTYAFERARYWVPDPTHELAMAGSLAAADVRTFVTAFLQQALDLMADGFDGTRTFRDYGVDSIVGVSLVRALNRRFELDLSGRVLLEYPNIDALTRHLETLVPRAGAERPNEAQMRSALRDFRAGALSRAQVRAMLERSAAG